MRLIFEGPPFVTDDGVNEHCPICGAAVLNVERLYPEPGVVARSNRSADWHMIWFDPCGHEGQVGSVNGHREDTP